MNATPPATISRRSLLGALAAGTMGSALLPGVSFSAMPGRDPRRFVLVVLRGAMDGVSAVPPIADPDYAAAKGALALAAPGAADGALPLDGRFALHPALKPLHGLYGAGELLIVHAVASPYRERSHFDAQNLLETGVAKLGARADGWLNRTLAALGGERWSGLAVGGAVPLVIQGKMPVSNWKPEAQPTASAGMMLAVARMYDADPALSKALTEGLRTADMIDAAIDGSVGSGAGRRINGSFPTLAGAVGRIMAAGDGPNIAVMELGGWDTHVGQGAAKGRLATALTTLADGLAGMRNGLGARWKDTVVVAVTEFGRTIAPNGSGGTDHGTGSALFLLGGAVQGGRVITDWPGLAKGALYQGRDLAPTTDIRAVLKGALGDHLKVRDAALEADVFPDSRTVKALSGLIHA